MRIDMCIDMCVDMCEDVCVGMRVDILLRRLVPRSIPMCLCTQHLWPLIASTIRTDGAMCLNTCLHTRLCTHHTCGRSILDHEQRGGTEHGILFRFLKKKHTHTPWACMRADDAKSEEARGRGVWHFFGRAPRGHGHMRANRARTGSVLLIGTRTAVHSVVVWSHN